MEVQIFISLVVVLGTAFVALVCDFLKGNNERLREKNVELEVRQEERERTAIQDPVNWLRDLATVLRDPQTGRLVQPGRGAVVTDHHPAGARVAREEAHPVEARAREEARHAEPPETLAGPVPVEQPQWASGDEMQMAEQRAARIRARRQTAEPKLAAPLPEPTFSADPEVPARPKMAAEPPPSAAPAFSGLEALAPEPVAAPAVAPIVPQAEPAETTVAVAIPPESTGQLAVEEIAVDSSPEVAPEPTLEVAPGPAAPAREIGADTASEIILVKVLPIDAIAAGRFEQAPAEAASPEPVGPELVAPEFPGASRVEDRADDPPAPLPAEIAARFAVEEPVNLVDPAESPAGESLEMPAAESHAAAVGGQVPSAVAEPAPEVPRVAEIPIPAGLHPGEELSVLMESGAPFSGVAVAIGINDYEAVKSRTPAHELTASLTHLIDSMLRDRDFACRFTEDEYILLFPSETGGSAQRRLYHVSEKLWDYQLRSLGGHGIMFSWGGLEVQREPVQEAVTSARERMFQTKRNRSRSAPPMEFSSSRQMVVNG